MFGMLSNKFENNAPFFFNNFISLDEICQNHEPLFRNNIQENSLISNFDPLFKINGNMEESSEDSKKTSNESKKDIRFLTEVINHCSKKGRKTKRNNKIGNKCHDKNSYDNIIRKIQVNFISFIIKYANAILQTFCNLKFLKIDYKFKKNVNKSSFKNIKNKKISEILCQKISEKYKKINKETNRQIVELYIDTNPELKQIFSETYVDLFKNIYYLGKREISLKINGENKIISLYGIEMFKDLLDKIRKEDKENIEYINRIKKCVEDNFFN
jgi:hypothetical protein